jgi:hypothetical protein
MAAAIAQPSRSDILRWVLNVEADPERKHVLRDGSELRARAVSDGLIVGGRDEGYFARTIAELRDQGALTFTFYDRGRTVAELPTFRMDSTELGFCFDFLPLAGARALLPSEPAQPIQILIGQLVAGDINRIQIEVMAPMLEELLRKVDELDAPDEIRAEARSRISSALSVLKSAGTTAGAEFVGSAAARFLAALLGIG